MLYDLNLEKMRSALSTVLLQACNTLDHNSSQQRAATSHKYAQGNSGQQQQQNGNSIAL
jgi:hypothetical protein